MFTKVAVLRPKKAASHLEMAKQLKKTEANQQKDSNPQVVIMIEQELVEAGLVDSLHTIQMVVQEAVQALLSRLMLLFQKDALNQLMNTMKIPFQSHTRSNTAHHSQ